MKKQEKVEKKYFFGSKLQRKSTFERSFERCSKKFEHCSKICAMFKNSMFELRWRVEILERGMAELMKEHMGRRDSNMEPAMQLEGTLNIQEFNSMELLQDAQKMNKMKEELAEEMEMLKADMKVELKEQLKKELRQELLEDLKLQMEAALSKEFGHEKELLRKIKMCFLSNDNDSERHEETDSQSQDSVSLLERCGYP